MDRYTPYTSTNPNVALPDGGVTIPIKRVDPDATLDERLTDNVKMAVGPARYFLKDDDGNVVEDWGDVFHRVARNVAEAEFEFGGSEEHVELWTERFESMLRRLEFVPNSPTLMNAGTPIQQLSACFVVSPEDDMEQIFATAQHAAMIMKSGGGIGYAFHHLRPMGAIVDSTGGTASGPISFMRIFDEVCNTVKQGGKRRGAQMAIMHVQHPDVGRFAVAKRDENRFNNFNISIGITDDFVDAVIAGDDYTLYDPEVSLVSEKDRVAFETAVDTAHFYDPQFEDAWNDELDTPGMGLNGQVVEENFWRDYLGQMSNPEAFEEYRDQIELTPGEGMTLPAGFIWQLLVDGAHANGEPGIFYFDETNRDHSFDVQEHPDHIIHSTNPCGEQPLENFEACNLGHVNLSTLLRESAPDWREFEADSASLEEQVEQFLLQAVDVDELEYRVALGTRFLDNVVTQSEFPLDEISEGVRSLRKIGLGVMGWHQMLIQMGVQYGSVESYEIARQVMGRIDAYSKHASHLLAEERGVFPEWGDSKWADPQAYPEWFARHGHLDADDYPDGYKIRNHNTTTVAPTGTTSMIGDTSGGIEPIYQVAYFKNVGRDIQGDDMLVEFDDYFLRVLEANDIDVEAMKEEAERQMRSNEFEGVDSLPIPDEIADLFVTTQDLTAEQHTRMQGAFQEAVDSGLSKTVNLPNEATLEDVSDAFKLAIDLGIKGATVYRDGSRSEQVNTTRVDNGLDDETELEDVAEQELVDAVVARFDESPSAFNLIADAVREHEDEALTQLND